MAPPKCVNPEGVAWTSQADRVSTEMLAQISPEDACELADDMDQNPENSIARTGMPFKNRMI